ncbi:uncharacterized protein LOC111069223 [Drosophila obscura]|uniref:uncharacterized protein LOC111069223 n=1 Tax=Drosophila obscura TaxID=7282 RepID=UPI001BB1203D|nr:uncharacterized protein LOC111069223 [Drosophila obscura]
MDFNALLQAIKCCLADKNPAKGTAKAYGIPRSSLMRYIKKVSGQFGEISSLEDSVLFEFVRNCSQRTPSNMVFSSAQEKDLVQHILKCVNQSINELRKLAYQFAKKLEVDYPENWDKDQMAGRHWYTNFIRRHSELALRSPKQNSIHTEYRVKAFCKKTVDIFFRNFGQLLDEHHFEATHIYNMDESGFSTCRHVGKIQAAERRTMITIALTVNATGNSIPPFFLFPRKEMQTSFLDNVSSGTVGFANGSGRMCAPELERYIRHLVACVKPTPASPILLLLDDGNSSHLSIEAIDFAVANGVHILSFPPNCSHKMQPLDVSIYGPLKTYYKSECDAWQKNNVNKVLEIRHIAGLVCETLDLLTPKIIKRGFRATGISPFDPDIFGDYDFLQTDEQTDVSEAPVDEEDQRGSDFVRQEVVFTTPEPSTSSTSCLSLSEEIDPLRAATPKKSSNRGRKPMQSSLLTFPECIASMKEKSAMKDSKLSDMQASVSPQKKRGRKATLAKPSTKLTKETLTKPLAKRTKALSSDDDKEFCLICLHLLPRKLTAANSIKCRECSQSSGAFKVR